MTVQEFIMVFVPIIVSVLALCFSVYMSMKGNKRTDSKDIEERVVRETKLDMKLNEIGNDVKEVKETVRTIQNDVKDHEGRIVKLEASYSRLHERVDNFPKGER